MTVLNLQVGASTDDAYEAVSGGAMSLSITRLRYGQYGGEFHNGLRWTGVTGLPGSAIDSVVLNFPEAQSSDSGSFIGDWFAHDAGAPGTFTSTTSNISDTAQRPRTTATCEADGSHFGSWTAGTNGGAGWDFLEGGAGSLKSIIQELADSHDPVDSIALLHIFVSGEGERLPFSYDRDSSNGAKLDITYTAGGGSTQTATPTPVAIPIAVPSPRLAMTPTPVQIPIAIPAPTVTGGSIKYPSPVVIQISVPTPTVSAGAVTLTPSPVVIPIAIPTPVVSGPGAAEEFVQWGEIVRFIDPDEYAIGAVFQIEVGMFTSSGSVPAKARLFNITDGVAVAGSEAETTETSYDVVRSGTFSLPSGLKKYRLEFGGQQGGVFSFHGGKVGAVSS